MAVTSSPVNNQDALDALGILSSHDNNADVTIINIDDGIISGADLANPDVSFHDSEYTFIA